MRVLIAFEQSGEMRRAFRNLGFDAYSVDLLDSVDDSPHHIVGDAWDEIGTGKYDLIVMHPTCTALCCSGNRYYGAGKPKHGERIAAMDYTRRLWEHAKKHAYCVALENPVGVLPKVIGPATQYIQPWQFGHGEVKRTGFWLHNLPALTPTDIVDGRHPAVWLASPSADRWKIRSKTYSGIAAACAAQWGAALVDTMTDMADMYTSENEVTA